MSLFKDRPEPTEAELVSEILDAAYVHATDENRMWYWLGYAAAMTDENPSIEEGE